MNETVFFKMLFNTYSCNHWLEVLFKTPVVKSYFY